MYRHIKDHRVVLTCLLSTAVAGCLQTRAEVEEAQEKRVLKQQLVTIQKKSADQTVMFDSIQEDFRNLNGRIEKLESYTLTNAEKRSEADSALDARLTAIENKIRMLEAAALDQDQRTAKALTSLRDQVGQDLKKISSNLSPSASSLKRMTDKGAFSEAEGLYDKKEWRKAILSYEKFRSAYPKSSRYAMATYKIGVCFSELGMDTEAEAFYSEVLEKFPKDKIAKSATYRLQKLKEKHKK